MTSIVINGKFLTAGLEGGVHRTALRFTRELVRHANRSGVPVRVVAPAPAPAGVDLGDVDVQVVPGFVGRGQAWEMMTLPSAARGALLVSLCNLGPIAHSNSAVMIHDVQPRLFPDDYPTRQRVGFRMVQDALGVRARQILTVSNFSKLMLLGHGVGSEEKIAVVPNGCDHIVDVAADERVFDSCQLEPDQYVLALGSLQAYKNIDTLFRAMPEPIAERYHLVVAGSPTAAEYRQRGWVPPEHATFTGRVTDAELRALYHGARAVAVPSLTEGFGLPPLEAMACGAPVVAARAGAIPEVCEGAALLADPRRVDTWVAGLSEACTDDSSRSALRRAANRKVEIYTWANAGEQLWNALEPLVEPVQRRRRREPGRGHPVAEIDPLEDPMTDPEKLDVAVVVASVGRPESLNHLLGQLSVQTQLPSHVVLSVAADSDLPTGIEVPFPLDVIVENPKGLTIQRNRGLELLDDETDVVVFYDDDFVPTRTAVADVASFFAANSEIVGADGLVLADGATGPGITIGAALDIVDEAERSRKAPDLDVTESAGALYGCNMAYRYQAVKHLRFDEDLPLYGWFEDLDFGGRVDGPMAHCRAFQGVHRAEKKGRERGRRLGYSQVANPIYMVRKGTLAPGYGAKAVLRRVAMNHLRIVFSEPWVDRRGRTAGNWLAIADLLRGRMRPGRILEL